MDDMIISAATIVATTSSIEFRRMTQADIGDGLRLCRMNGWDQVARDWERFLTPPCDAIAAVRGGLVLGTCAAIPYGAVFGWIGMVLVDPAAQGQGLGAALLRHAAEMLFGVAAIRLDATPAGHPLYVKQAFVEEARLRRLERAPATFEVPSSLDEGHQSDGEGIRKMTNVELTEVQQMDALVFGAPRGELLDWMYRGAAEYAWVARRCGELTGYILGRHGYQFEHLGPIVARDGRTAAALAGACLSGHSDRAFIIDATCHDAKWAGFLERARFREQRPFIRMYRGGQPPFGEPHHQFAVTGPEFG
jgi:GNAT superfamily N-acetyltransferase